VKVLVVDDDPAIRDLASTALQREGYTVLTARDGEDGLARARADKPELVILDLMLPKLDGFEVCRILREESEIPIMMLTARGDDVDKVVGLEIGADDYLTKPFNPREMVARVKAIIRRSGRKERAKGVLKAGALVIDRARREVRRGELLLALRAKEFDLLVTFMEHPGLVLKREQLLYEVWGYDVPGETRTVDVHVNHLRRRIQDSGVTIETLRGVGYKFVSS
jgi:two-component system, OmpR family, alkaline phosphatase synthesis response regulator PhoP